MRETQNSHPEFAARVNLKKRSVHNFLPLLHFRAAASPSRNSPHVAAVWEPMMGIAVCGRDEKVETDTRCRAPLFALPPDTEEVAGGVTNVVRSRARKCALASSCIFQKTRGRRAAVKWHETDRVPGARAAGSSRLCAIACFFPCHPRNADNPIHTVRPPWTFL